MSAKEKVFVPFRVLSPSHPEYTSHCPAKTEKGWRCRSRLQECNIPRIKELLTKLQDSHEDTSEGETREDTLRRIASLSICGHQRNNIDAAVRQWTAEIQSQDSHSVGLQPPPENANARLTDDGQGSRLRFAPYRQAAVADELSRELNRIMDENIGAEFLKRIRDSKAERGYLYIFECEGAEGMYKVGRTKRHTRRAAEQERCYSSVVERWTRHCPNAELFEKIIQLQFAQCRYQHDCVRCKRAHTEWFKAPYDDIARHIHLWSEFSRDLQRGDTFAKLSQMTIPLPGTSSDPDRWYRWALGYIETWRKRSPVPELSTSDECVVNKASAIEDRRPDGDTVAVPARSPSSSTPGSPGDDSTGRPSLTLSIRTRKRS
ncbi:hypothetical protein BDV10DRAFT_187911 [Aspergillus recurvatus]